MSYRLGRLHRTYNPRIPHLSALTAGTPAPTIPAAQDWTSGLPTKPLPAPLGMMLNDSLGDCTCAAFYHAMQVWSDNASGAVLTEPDADVEKLYIQACGYNPRAGGEGPGGNEQSVLTFLLNKGAPTGPAGTQRHRITAFVEVDPRNIADVKRTIFECGVAYIGFNVPAFLMPAPPQQPPTVWDVQTSNTNIIGGHAVVLAGYDQKGARVISWGGYYTMTWAFFSAYVDEVYAIADQTWFNAKHTTPGGLTLEELEQQMAALKADQAQPVPQAAAAAYR